MGIAQLVERCLAKAKVAGSNPVSHSRKEIKIARLIRAILFDIQSLLSFYSNSLAVEVIIGIVVD